MRIAVLIFSIALCSASHASDRIEKIRRLMEAQGVLQIFQEQMTQGQKTTREQADQVLDQFTKSLNPSKEFDDRFRAAMRDYVKSLDAPWSAQDVVNEWARAYGSKFTDRELDDLLGWYTSPLGKKDTSVSQEAIAEVMAHFQTLGKPIFQRETQKFLERIKQIAKECNCAKT